MDPSGKELDAACEMEATRRASGEVVMETAADAREAASRQQQHETRAEEQESEDDEEPASGLQSFGVHSSTLGATEPLSLTRPRRETTAAAQPKAGKRRQQRAGAATEAATGSERARRNTGAADPRTTLRKAIAMGPLAVDRVVGGRYEWRDGGLRWPKTRAGRRREPG